MGTVLKICSDCSTEKPLEEFYPRSKGSDKLCNRCKDCSKKHSAAMYEKHKHRYKDGWRKASANYRRTRKFGLQPGEFDAMIQEQEGRCAICTKEVGESLAIDHDHATGKVRGLLCSNCNTGLGMFKDDPILLAAAIAYLKPEQTTKENTK